MKLTLCGLARVYRNTSTAFLVGTLLAATSAVYAQDAPTELNANAAQEAPTDDGFVAKAKRFADKTQIVERLNGDVDGWYPRLGGMTRGSGFALGPGYRTHLGAARVFVDVSAGVSIKGYRAADANIRWLQLFGERVEFWTDLRYENFPQEDFFGTGMTSLQAARTSYDFDSAGLTLRGVARPVPWLHLGTAVGYLRPDIGPGTDDKYPSIEQMFTDAEAPGLADQPDFLHTTFSAEVDTLDASGNPRAGAMYRAAFGIWDDRTLQQFDHRRFDLLLTHYVPLVADKRHVISGRFGTSYVNNETGERVPFYFLAYVGGRDTIRSFREFRFKDENALWLGAEYRWVPITWVSVAAFVDAGEATPNWNDIDFRGMKTGYGFGIRAHSRTQTFASIDVGTGGGEGWKFFLKLGI